MVENKVSSRNRHKGISPWFIPLIGVIVGIIYAYISITGLTETWHYLGNPSERITRILGFVGLYDLFVETGSGEVYSIHYDLSYERSGFPNPIQWTKRDRGDIVISPQHELTFKLYSWPPLFRVRQIYEFPFDYPESNFLVKFALSEDGNLWGWNAGQGGLSGLLCFIFPARGFLFGLVPVLLIKLGSFVLAAWRRRKP